MWLVVGYGSALHTDDGFGLAVVDTLMQDKLLETALQHNELEFLCANQLLPEWAESVSRASGVIFVDASAELAPGEICCIQVNVSAENQASEDERGTGSFTHYYTPVKLVQLAQTLYGRVPPAWFYMVRAEDFRLGETLSPATAEMVPQVAAMIRLRLMSQMSKQGISSTFK